MTVSRRDVAGVGLLAAWSILVFGYAYGRGDLAVYLPLIEHARDPSWLSHDWFVTRGPGVHAPYVWLMARAGAALPLPVVFLVTHILERLALMAVMVLFGRALTGSREAAWLGAVVAVLSYAWNPGANDLFYAVTIPHTLATVPAVLALTLSLRGRMTAAAAVAGLTTIFHELIGLEVGVLIVACAVWREGGPGRGSRRAAAAFALCAIPGLASTVLAQFTGSGPDVGMTGSAYIALVGGLRAPWHYLPSFWTLGTYAAFLLYLAAGIRALSGDDGAALPAEGRRQARFYLAAIVALCVLGALGVEWLRNATILKLQFFRLTIFMKLLVAVLLAHAGWRRIRQGRPGSAAPAWLLMAATTDPVLFGFVLAVQTGFEAAGAVDASTRRRASGAALVAAGLTLCLAFDVGGVWRPDHISAGTVISLKKVLLLAGVAVALECWRLARAVRSGRVGWAVALSVVVIATLTACGLLVVRARVTVPGAAAALAARVQVERVVAGPWGDVMTWVERHTAPEVVFLTPPYMEDFRIGARRAIVVDFKSFAFRDRDAAEWERRLTAVTGGVPFTLRGDRWSELRAGYASLTTADAVRIGGGYGAAYVIREATQPLDLPIAFRNAGWSVYRLR